MFTAETANYKAVKMIRRLFLLPFGRRKGTGAKRKKLFYM